ncbi:MAG: hypothetical protein IT164_04180 [Bryobacterales bacterium]|nr:hypothetical protein [Bryobacterales bacterium]
MTAAAFCRQCGKPLTEGEQADSSTIYCAVCAAARSQAATPAAAHQQRPIAPAGAAVTDAAGAGISPGLAFLLGILPGVGAIYNAQYAKGLIHVVIFGLLISIAGSPGSSEVTPVFVVLIPAFITYMAFEAYHTAKKRAAGISVDEFSSLVPMRRIGFPVAPVLLIGSGVVFLLNNLGVLRFSQLFRWWPLLLIGLGVYMLLMRLTGGAGEEQTPPSGGLAAGYQDEVRHEQ